MIDVRLRWRRGSPTIHRNPGVARAQNTVCTLVLYTGTELLWVRSRSSVEWAWTCTLPAWSAGVRASSPPPLHFWFMPLGTRNEQASVVVNMIGTDQLQSDTAIVWSFKWRITNQGGRGTTLKIKIWSPEGVTIQCESEF